MKVIAFNGSPHQNGNTAILINRVLAALRRHDIDTEMVHVGGQALRGCRACGWCGQNPVRKCVLSDDLFNECLNKMVAADGIIIGSPTYYANMTAETKALIDRAGSVTRRNGFLLQRKAGAAVVALRRAGGINTFNAINDFFLINQMIVPGSSYWNLGMGNVNSDDEGFKTMETLAENMAWLLKLIKSAQ